MKNILRFGAMMMASCILITSCSKTALVPAEDAATLTEKQQASVRFMKKQVTDRFGEPPANQSAMTQNAAPGGGEGSVFIIPFMSEESSGVGFFDFANFTLELAFFTGKMGQGDFYRRNPDGTVSVKINTQNADIFYTKNAFGPDPVFTGTKGNFSTTYTGPVKQEPIFDLEWNIIGYRDVVDLQNATRVVRMVGNGNIQEAGNPGSAYHIVVQAVTTTSGQSSSFITLN